MPTRPSAARRRHTAPGNGTKPGARESRRSSPWIRGDGVPERVPRLAPSRSRLWCASPIVASVRPEAVTGDGPVRPMQTPCTALARLPRRCRGSISRRFCPRFRATIPGVLRFYRPPDDKTFGRLHGPPKACAAPRPAPSWRGGGGPRLSGPAPFIASTHTTAPNFEQGVHTAKSGRNDHRVTLVPGCPEIWRNIENWCDLWPHRRVQRCRRCPLAAPRSEAARVRGFH